MVSRCSLLISVLIGTALITTRPKAIRDRSRSRACPAPAARPSPHATARLTPTTAYPATYVCSPKSRKPLRARSPAGSTAARVRAGASTSSRSSVVTPSSLRPGRRSRQRAPSGAPVPVLARVLTGATTRGTSDAAATACHRTLHPEVHPRLRFATRRHCRRGPRSRDRAAPTQVACPSSRENRMSRRRAILAGFVSAALAVPLSLSAAQAAPGDEPPSGPGSSVPMVRPDGLQRAAGETNHPAISPALIEADGVVTAFVELDAPSGIETAEAGGDAADVAAAAEDVLDIAEEVVPADAGTVAEETPAKIDVTTNVVSGMVVTGDAEQLRALADDPAVTAVYLVVPKTIDNKGTDVFTRALETWTSTGATGDGVTIGVIDTGLDYTHATFGGAGTTDAYAEAYGTDGTDPIPAGGYDPAKFLGGYDFAGPSYDASGSTAAELVPVPDENPIDAPHTGGNGGHGSHVAGTAAGYGVLPDGSTFDGDYTTLTDISGWRIGPGTAPEAGLYALKVFGDAGGSTSLSILALEWAADPNGDGSFDDHLDIVNMSLGSNFSTADDPENLFVNELAGLGVLTVTSAGNGSDVTDVGGSPGSARSALTVANSVGNTATFDAVEVTAAADSAVLGLHAAQNSANYAGTVDVTAPVAFIGAAVSGCTSLEADRAQIAGKIVWLWWDDNDATRACGSAVRWNSAQAAGAVGVLIGTELAVFPAGIAGNAGIPGAQLTATSTVTLLPQIQNGSVVVHLGPSLANAAMVTDPALGDMLNSGSSRGVHGSLGVVKPDVAAPGTLISSAASGTGTDRVTYSGTSMSSPH